MLTPEDHAKLLRSFEVDRLLKLVTLEAKRLHDGHYAIFAFTNGYKVAFGTPDLDSGQGRSQLRAMPGFPTLKEALIAALVARKDFFDACDRTRDLMLFDEVFPCGPVLTCPRDQCRYVHQGHMEVDEQADEVRIFFSCEWCCGDLVLAISTYHGQALIGWRDRHGDTPCGPDCERYPTAAV